MSLFFWATLVILILAIVKWCRPKADKRIFMSLSIKDAGMRNLLVSQGKNNEGTTFSFVYMSVKQSWDSSWETNCRTKIRGCDGMVCIISTPKAEGQQSWELNCANEESVPILLIDADVGDRPANLPKHVKDRLILTWIREIAEFLERL